MKLCNTIKRVFYAILCIQRIFWITALLGVCHIRHQRVFAELSLHHFLQRQRIVRPLPAEHFVLHREVERTSVRQGTFVPDAERQNPAGASARHPVEEVVHGPATGSFQGTQNLDVDQAADTAAIQAEKLLSSTDRTDGAIGGAEQFLSGWGRGRSAFSR